MRGILAVLGIGLALCLPLDADGERSRVSPTLWERAAEGELVRVIVELREQPGFDTRDASPAGRRARRRRIATSQAVLAADLALARPRFRRPFRNIPFAVFEVDAEGLNALEESPHVVAIEEDRVFSPSLDVSVPLVEADHAASLGYDGSGQTVVILDTGVDALHPNLVGKIVSEACFAKGNPYLSGDCPQGGISEFNPGSGGYCGYSGECDHGTHVAGIVAGAGPGYSGVAPAATLVSVQVFSEFTGSSCGSSASPCPRSYRSDQIEALEYVYDTLRFAHTIASVNMSLGGSAFVSQASCDSANAAMKAAVENLRSVGIATVIAAGNDGLTAAISEPACISPAVSVGATSDNDVVASFSNAASFLSLWAPGVSIVAPQWMGASYVSKNGTSMAAPHVAGAWAILLQALPGLSVDGALSVLGLTGTPIVHSEANTVRIHLASALDQVLPDCGDGFDDDGDGFTDGDDPGCASPTDVSERGVIDCDDGIDNDGDGLSDHPEDPGCASPFHPSESPACNDGMDDDGDGFTDFPGDPDCDAHWDDSESPHSCGLGVEIGILLSLLAPLVRRRSQESDSSVLSARRAAPW